MTTIAYKDGILAADKRSTFCNVAITTTKVKRLQDGTLVGCTGDSGLCRKLIEWLQDGADPDTYPDLGSKCHMLMVRPDRRVYLYDGSSAPIELEERFVAFGSGQDFALTAMHLGYGAKEAVEVACQLDVHSGKGVDALVLKPVA